MGITGMGNVRTMTHVSRWKTKRARPKFAVMVCRVAVAVVAGFLITSASHADQSGSSARIDQHAVIRIDGQRITVDYTMMMNRAGAYQEVLAIDENRDGRMSTAEQEAYFDTFSRQIAAGIDLSLDGREQSLGQVGQVQLSMPFTKRIQFQVDQRSDWQTACLEFHNDNYLAALGNVSIDVEMAGPVELTFNSLASPGIEKIATPSPCSQQRDVIIRYRNAGKLQRLDSVGTPAPAWAAFGHSSIGTINFDRAATGLGLALVVAALVLVGLNRNSLRHSRSAWWLSTLGLLLLVSLLQLFALNLNLISPYRQNLSNDEAKRVLSVLHQNTYLGLRAKNEAELYETLASSLDGDLLHATYLEMHPLSLAPDQGTGFQVHRIKALESEVLREGSNMKDRFRIRHRWRVYGIISHAGHRHARVNEYEATFSVSKTQYGWRISRASVQDYHRTNAGIVFATILP